MANPTNDTGGNSYSWLARATDKLVAAVSPSAAVKRAKSRAILNSGYGEYGANAIKKALAGYLAGGGSSKEDIENNIDTLRRRSRDLYMGGATMATGALKTMRTNVVGRGLKLKSKVDAAALGISDDEAKALELKIQREFALWADGTACDLERLDNFYELQQLVFLNWLLSGDVIVLLPTTERADMPYDLRIQLIEADRVSTPPGKSYNSNIIQGVEFNESGEVVAYHISAHHPYGDIDKYHPYKWQRVKAYGSKTGRRNVLHIMNRERIGQRRGVPLLAPVIADLKQIGRYTEAELTAAVIASYFTIFIEKEEDSGEPPLGEAIPIEQQIDAEDETSIEIAPGAVYDLGAGEKANAVAPGRPNTAFDGFVKAMAMQIGAALEIPYELLMKSFQASYSASRAALLEAWKMFKMYREWLASDFCQPIYEEWLAEAVAKGRISAPGFFSDPIIRKAYSGADWNGPAQGLLNPIQEVQAAIQRIDNGLSSRSREAMEINGSDFNDNVKELRAEKAAMREVTDNGEE